MDTSFKVRFSNFDTQTTFDSPILATFADGQLTDAIKHLASDPSTDPKVKKKLIAVLASWHNQFKTDPSMALVANLYRQCRPPDRRSKQQDADIDKLFGKMVVSPVDTNAEYERRRKEKEEKELAKRKAKEAKERARREEEARRKRGKTKRQPFDFEKVRNAYFRLMHMYSYKFDRRNRRY